MKFSRIIVILLIGLCLVIDHVKPSMRVSDLAALKDGIKEDSLAVVYIYDKKDRLGDIFYSLDKEFGDVISFVKGDLRDDKRHEIKRYFGIKKTPVIILFKYGRERARFTPKNPKNVDYEDLEGFIEKNFDNLIVRKRVRPTGGLFFNFFYGPRYRYPYYRRRYRYGRWWPYRRRYYGRPRYRRYRRRYHRGLR